MDFKDQNHFDGKTKNDSEHIHSNNGGNVDQNKKIGSKLWQSARKCTEVIQRKLKKSPATEQQQQLKSLAAAVGGGGSISSPSQCTKPIQANAAVPPIVDLGPFSNQTSQVTRRGHRPLSAIVTSSSNNNNNHSIQQHFQKSVSKSATSHSAAAPVIDSLDVDDLSDSEQEAADRRLLRSKIIKSFWEQHDQEGGDFSEPEVGSDK